MGDCNSITTTVLVFKKIILTFQLQEIFRRLYLTAHHVTDWQILPREWLIVQSMASYLVINLNLFFALQWCSQITHLDFIIVSDKSVLCFAHRKTFTVEIDTVLT